MTKAATTARRPGRGSVQERPLKGEIEELRLTVLPVEAPPQGPAAVRSSISILARWLVRYHEEQSRKPRKSP